MQSIGSEIWVVEQPFQLPLIGNLGVRMTVIRLSSKDLMCISPISWNEEIDRELRKLGNIRYLVAPNSTHHLFLQSYQEHYPQALAASPLKLQKKRPELKFQIDLIEGKDFPWGNEVEMVLVDSRTSMSEAVFFHRNSRTLIVTDLLFHFLKAENWLQKIALKLNGAHGKLALTKVGQKFWNDRDLLRAAVKKIALWDFDQIVLAHGQLVTENGKKKFLDAFKRLDL